MEILDRQSVVSEHYAVGDLYITTKKHESGESVGAQQGYGKWQRYGEGRALIGVSTIDEQPDWTKETGSTFGEYEHSLSVSELPADACKARVAGYHGSRVHDSGGTGYASGSNGGLTALDSSETGWQGESFSVTQPSIAIGVWVRVE